MSKAPGVPLSTYDLGGKAGVAPKTPLAFSQKENIMRQLGWIYASLSNVRSDRLGSLVLSDKGYEIGKCVYPGFVWKGRDDLDDGEIQRGPFSDVEAFYRALVSAFLAHAKELPMEYHLFHAPLPNEKNHDNHRDYKVASDRWNAYSMFGSKVESNNNRLDYILAGIALMDLVPLLAGKDHQLRCSGFPLCHPDLNLGNIYVDEHLDISCIIDWGFAAFLPQSMLFVCPGLPHPRDGADSNLEPSFAQGSIGGGGFDGQKDLNFSNSNLFWKFRHLVNFDFYQDYPHFSDFLLSLTGQEVYPVFEHLKHREEFIQASQTLAAPDPEDDYLSGNEEEQFFAHVDPVDVAISRHLTVIAELNPRFVVSDRLWNWILSYVDERDLYMFPALDAHVPLRFCVLL